MKLYHWITLLFLMSASVFFNLQGINWGLPSKERTDLVFPEQFHTESFYSLMKQTREEIYKFSEGSPIGRLKNSSLSLTPILQSMGVQENGNLFFNGDEKILANFIRPYLLRSNHTDEQMTIASLSGMYPKSFDFNPRIFPYGGVYIYGMGVWLGLSHVFDFIKISHDLNFYFQYSEEMAKIFVAGRLLNIFFSTFTMIIIFTIAKKIYSIRTAILSILFFAISPAMIFQTHIMKPYTMATTFAMLCVYYSLVIITTTPSIKNYVLCGIFAGLTIGTMSTYGIIILAPLFAHFSVSKLVNKKLVYCCLASLVTFLITNPYWLLKFNDMLWEMKGSAGCYASGNLLAIVGFFVHQLPIGVPVSLLLLCFLGVILSIFQKENWNIPLISVSVVPLIIFGFLLRGYEPSMHNTRFLLPWISILLILAARFVDIFLNKKYVSFFIVLLIIFAIIQSTLSSAICIKNFLIDSSANSTRLEAGRWISDNIPANSIIGTNYMPEPAHFPPFDFSKYKMEVMQRYNLKKLPEYFICVNEVPKEILNNKNYTLTQSFKPLESIFGFRFSMGSTHINSSVYILKRIS
ncbi:MAG: glycosyltransferase family 39 protein [Elusimicrobiota bacterium]